MNAVEFQTTLNNGVINLPTHQQLWNGKKVKVILLEETSSDVTEIVSNAATTESDFFSYAGIWENRDINQESIRAKAWQDNKFIKPPLFT